jgi:hypothetical protein
VAGAAPVSFACIAWASWSFAFDTGGNETVDKLAWSAVLELLAGLTATTGLLLARRPTLVGLASVAGALSGLAATVSVAGIWTEPDSESFVKVLAVLWILAALTYVLVPILQRFSSVNVEESAVRVLGELTVGARRIAGLARRFRVDSPAPGEQLVLRRRPRSRRGGRHLVAQRATRY